MTKEEIKDLVVEMVEKGLKRNIDTKYLEGKVSGMVTTFCLLGYMSREEGFDLMEEISWWYL